MKERPILFNSEMVRAVLDGRKTQTRRVMKEQPGPVVEAFFNRPGAERILWVPLTGPVGQGIQIGSPRPCPYGVPGDRLWCRETWADVNTEDGPSLLYAADGRMRNWREFSETFGPDFGAGPSMDYDAYPGEYSMWWSDLWYREERNCKDDHHWRRSIHMPRWASRLTLEVVNVRVERLQEISQDDARAEGMPPADPDELVSWKPVGWFSTLWDSINEKRGYGWDVNPWVWVVEFKPTNPDGGS